MIVKWFSVLSTRSICSTFSICCGLHSLTSLKGFQPLHGHDDARWEEAEAVSKHFAICYLQGGEPVCAGGAAPINWRRSICSII